MLWFLLTAYLCAGCYVAGRGAGHNTANGAGSSLTKDVIVVLTWPRFYFDFSKFFTKQ